MSEYSLWYERVPDCDYFAFYALSCMNLCLVTGTVVATRKSERFERSKLLIVQRIGLDGQPLDGKDELALDPRYGAGVGDVVLVAKEGDIVTQVVGPGTPANVVVIGVVDDWER